MSLQDDIINVIAKWQNDHGRTPTVRQIAEMIGLSKSTVADHCALMNRDGIISREKRCRRVTILTDEIKSFDEMKLNVQSLSYQNKRLFDDVERLKAGLRLAEAHTDKRIAEALSVIPSMSELS